MNEHMRIRAYFGLSIVCTAVVFCAFGQNSYDPHNPNPGQWDVDAARNTARNEEHKAFEFRTDQLEAQRHMQRAMDAHRQAIELELRMQRNQQMQMQKQAEELQPVLSQGGGFNLLPTDQELLQEAQAIVWLEAHEPKIEYFCNWKICETYSNRASARQAARRNYMSAYEKWAKKLGQLHYRGYGTKSDLDKKIRDAQKAFEEYANLYDSGMFLTQEPLALDYSDRSRYIAHYIAFKCYIPHGVRTSKDRSEYIYRNRSALQAMRNLAGAMWDYVQTEKRRQK